jgi:hypothetical protein
MNSLLGDQLMGPFLRMPWFANGANKKRRSTAALGIGQSSDWRLNYPTLALAGE